MVNLASTTNTAEVITQLRTIAPDFQLERRRVNGEDVVIASCTYQGEALQYAEIYTDVLAQRQWLETILQGLRLLEFGVRCTFSCPITLATYRVGNSAWRPPREVLVLLTGQRDPAENGIYAVRHGRLERWLA